MILLVFIWSIQPYGPISTRTVKQCENVRTKSYVMQMFVHW
jgi:hypothetical protein